MDQRVSLITLGTRDMAGLAEDIGIPEETLGRGGITLGYVVGSKEDVAPLLDRAEAAGARIRKPAQDVFWGGYHGYFADPEGHIWEIAWNPFSPLGPKGEFQWNGAA